MLTKIDEILAWEKQKDAERDTKLVELGRYLCEVRAGQYWRVENVKSFDDSWKDGFRIAKESILAESLENPLTIKLLGAASTMIRTHKVPSIRNG